MPSFYFKYADFLALQAFHLILCQSCEGDICILLIRKIFAEFHRLQCDPIL